MPPRDSEPQMVALSAEPADERWAGESDLETVLVLRPRSAPQVVDLWMEVFVRRLLACLGIGMALWLPLRAAMPLYTRTFTSTSFNFDYGLFFGWLAALSVTQALIGVLATTAVTLLSYEELLGRELTPLAALRRTFRRFPALIGIFLVRFAVLTIGGSLLGGLSFFCPPLFIGAVLFYLFFAWKLSVAPSALILEDLGVKRALARSFELTRGSFWRWFGVMFLSGLLVFQFALGMQVGDNPSLHDAVIESLGVPGVFFDAGFLVVSSLFAGINSAVMAIGVTAYYLDTRIRREGFDLVMRLERLRRASSAIEEPAR